VGDIFEQGWLIGFTKHALWADFLLHPMPSVIFNFQNLGFIPAYPMTSYAGWSSFDFSKSVSGVLPVLELHG
jgi:hypothetical protein